MLNTTLRLNPTARPGYHAVKYTVITASCIDLTTNYRCPSHVLFIDPAVVEDKLPSVENNIN